MTLLAALAGAFAVGFALVVVTVYSVASARGCLSWRVGAHVLALGVFAIVHVTLSTVTLLEVPEVRAAQPWRAPLLAALHMTLAVSMVWLFATVRERVASSCADRGHRDRWHRPPQTG